MPRWADDAALRRALRAWHGSMAGAAGALWRHWLPILGCIVVVLGLAAAYIGGRTPLYRATTLVALSQGSIGQGAPAQDHDPEDQLRRIESRAMAEQLVERLDLHFVPEFQPGMISGSRRVDPWLPPPMLEWLPTRLAETLGAGQAEGEMTDEQRAVRLRTGVIEAAMSRTRAEVVRPMVLGVQFVSADPQLAAAGANALAALYLEEQRALRRDPSRRDRERLGAEIERLRVSIREAEQAIGSARASVPGGMAHPREQTWRALPGELAFWRRERAKVEGRLRLTEAALASGVALEVGALAAGGDRLVELRAREAELERTLAALAQEHGEQDPRVVELRTELAALQGRRHREIELIASRLRQEVEIIRSREMAIEAEIKELEERTTQVVPSAGEDLLERKLQAERAQLQERLDQLEQLELHGARSLPAARIVAPALTPDEPFQPRPAMVYGVALAGGVLLGVVLAFVLESVRGARPSRLIPPAIAGLAPLRARGINSGDGEEASPWT